MAGNKTKKRVSFQTESVEDIDGQTKIPEITETANLRPLEEVNPRKLSDSRSMKYDLADLKKLHLGEAKELSALKNRIKIEMDQLEKRHRSEQTSLLQRFEEDLKLLDNHQQLALDRLKEEQRKGKSRKTKELKVTQQKEEKQFKEKQKSDRVDLKHLPKHEARLRKEELNKMKAEEAKEFKEKQAADWKEELRIYEETQQAEMNEKVHKFSLEKHNKLKDKEKTLGEIMVKQLKEKHQAEKGHQTEVIQIEKQQMIHNQKTELGQMKTEMEGKRRRLHERHSKETKRNPSFLKTETRSRLKMYKEQLNIDHPDYSPGHQRRAVKDFSDSEKRRSLSEMTSLDFRHQRQIQELEENQDKALEDLHIRQNEDLKKLMTYQSMKMAEKEEEHQDEMKQLKKSLQEKMEELNEELSLSGLDLSVVSSTSR